jgi:hypothetical protein
MLALAGAGAALAQTPAQPPAADAPANPDKLAAAREENRRSAENLSKFEIPMSTEPAFNFRA